MLSAFVVIFIATGTVSANKNNSNEASQRAFGHCDCNHNHGKTECITLGKNINHEAVNTQTRRKPEFKCGELIK
ncbi:hypothetical protein GC194_03650 [bacterium]|nr:hypothetical protein [bacterium]